jgi:glutathione synthase/RimK-type ligase-like ATP-grasp enzyme
MTVQRPNTHTDAASGTELPVKPQKGVFFLSVPDNYQVDLVPDGRGGVTPILPNSVVFPRDIAASLVAKVDMIWFPPRNADALNGAPWIINNSADADTYEASLTWFSTLPAAKQVPVFNHPDAISRTRRDRISRTLQNIPGLVVPKCVRFKPERPRDFLQLFHTEGFQYPVLIRPVGSQTGRHLVKIDGPDSWSNLNRIPWGGSHMFMTQFIDFAGADNRYTKIRIACVGPDHLLRHTKFSDNWLVHNESKANERVSDEMRILDELATCPILKKVIKAVMKHVRLDYWGMDIGYQGPGKPFVFFEANASMSILRNGMSQKSSNMPATPDGIRKSEIKDVVRELLAKHLASPGAWISGREAAADP